MVQGWMLSRGFSDVATERHDRGSGRTPDVSGTSPGGLRVAFEVQYATLSVNVFERRDEALASGGWVPIWLWGHRGTGDQVELRAVHQHLLAQGRRLW
jgi:competence CoiA-like predicted nuclease